MPSLADQLTFRIASDVIVPLWGDFFVNTLPLWQWGIIAAIPPAILALYFLKLRRQPLAVPSTYLWAKAIEDLHVNSLWQRLRQSLLLLLQILLVMLLAFALLRPGWQGTEDLGDRIVFLVDTSASMSSTDIGPTRLDDAKRQAALLISQMKSGDVAMVISFSDTARIEQSFTDNRRLLESKVQLIEPTNRGSDLSEALRAASGLANPGQSSDPDNPNDTQVAEELPATLYILSDGGFTSVPSFRLGNLDPKYQRVAGESASNVAISAFSTEGNPEKPGEVQAFGRIENFSDQEVTTEVSLYLDDALLDAKSISISPRDPSNSAPGSTGVDFSLGEIESGVLKLEINAKDNLLLDNRAFAVVNQPKQAKVLLVTPGNDPLELALATDEAQKIAVVSVLEPEKLTTQTAKDQLSNGTYDLVIFDQCAPTEMPASNTLFIGRLPPLPEWTSGVKGLPIIADVDQVHPLTQLVQMSNVNIFEATAIEKAPPGSTRLIDSDLGSIYVVGPRGGYEDAVVSFDIYSQGKDGTVVNTNWPIRRSFPVFIMNAVKYLGGVRSSLASPNIKPGSATILRSDVPVKSLLVESPRGDVVEVMREATGNYMFTRVDELGVYKVREGSGQKVKQQFAANLFDSRESDLVPAEKLEIGHEEVKATTSRGVARQELWKWLLVLAIVVLVFEWYIYNRRVYL